MTPVFSSAYPPPRYDVAVIRHLATLRARGFTPPAAREESLRVLFDTPGTRYLVPTRTITEVSAIVAAARQCGSSFAPVLLRRPGHGPGLPTARKPGGGHWLVGSLLAGAPHVRVVAGAAGQLGVDRVLLLRGDRAVIAQTARITTSRPTTPWSRATAEGLIDTLLPGASLFAAGAEVVGIRPPSVVRTTPPTPVARDGQPHERGQAAKVTELDELIDRLRRVPGKLTRWRIEVLDRLGPGASEAERAGIARQVLEAPSRGLFAMWADSARLYELLSDWGLDVEEWP